MKHELKVWPDFFQAAWVGVKPFEIRLDDRRFQINDEVVLQEYDPDAREYTGREIEGVIIYVTSFNQKSGYVVFSYQHTRRSE